MLSGFLENIFGGRRKYEGNIETLKASSWLSICSVGSVLQSKCSQTVVLGNFLLFASFKMLPCPAPGCRVWRGFLICSEGPQSDFLVCTLKKPPEIKQWWIIPPRNTFPREDDAGWGPEVLKTVSDGEPQWGTCDLVHALDMHMKVAAPFWRARRFGLYFCATM